MRQVIIILLFAFALCTQAQRNKGPRKVENPNDLFLKTQMFIGIKFGSNLTGTTGIDSYHGFSPIDYNPEALDKDYQNFKFPGSQAGIDFTYYNRGFSLGIQPAYRVQRFGYTSNYSWGRDSTAVLFQTEQKIEQKLELIEIPVFLKYDLTRSALRPYVMVGFTYSLIIDGTKSIQSTNTDLTVDPAVVARGQVQSLGNKENFVIGTTGLLAGIGGSYDISNIRYVLELSYRQQLNNIINAQERFGINEISGVGDAYDDLTLRNLSLSFSVLFPLRFLTKDFAAF